VWYFYTLHVFNARSDSEWLCLEYCNNSQFCKYSSDWATWQWKKSGNMFSRLDIWVSQTDKACAWNHYINIMRALTNKSGCIIQIYTMFTKPLSEAANFLINKAFKLNTFSRKKWPQFFQMWQPQTSQSMEGIHCKTTQWLPLWKPNDYSLLHVHEHTPFRWLTTIHQVIYHVDGITGDRPSFSVDNHIQHQIKIICWQHKAQSKVWFTISAVNYNGHSPSLYSSNTREICLTTIQCLIELNWTALYCFVTNLLFTV